MTERHDLPRHTTPTWEMELLISGATVFALLQLPGVLDDLFYAAFPRYARPQAMLVLLPYLYVKATVYALIFTFVLHLATRAYWVGLVGLRSVHGDGVLWDKLKWGPIYRRVLSERTPPLDALVERADNRASLVFAYGVAFALLTLVPLLAVGLAALLAWLFQLLTGSRFAWGDVWPVALALTLGPLFLAMLLDRLIGRRLAEDGRASSALARVFRGYLRLGLASGSTYPLLVFVSRTGPRRSGLLLTAAFVAVFGFTFVQVMARAGEIALGNYDDLTLGEAGAARVVRNEHYAQLRGEADLSAPAPFIPAPIVRGDWLRLFVPFRPGRDSLALQAECEPAAALQADAELLHPAEHERLQADAARARTLDCLARIYAPTLDGVPLEAHFDAADDPETGLRGAVAMLPVKDLAPGRHELTIRRLPSPEADADEPAPPPHRIVFWR